MAMEFKATLLGGEYDGEVVFEDVPAAKPTWVSRFCRERSPGRNSPVHYRLRLLSSPDGLFQQYVWDGLNYPLILRPDGRA